VDGGEGKEMKRCPRGGEHCRKIQQRKCDSAGKNGKMMERGTLNQGREGGRGGRQQHKR